MNAIELKQLNKKMRNFKLKDINLKIPKGYITGFIGENGSGKTTLINHLIGLKKEDSGTIELLGFEDIESNRVELLNRIGIVFSEDNFPQKETAVSLEKTLKMFYKNWNSDQFYQYLKRFGVETSSKIARLSTGEKVKLSIAAALSHEAELLILDEPTSNLDPTFRIEFLELLQELMMDEEMTILFSTHITSDLEHIADYIVMIDDGEILFNMELETLTETYKKVKGPFEVLDDEIKELLIGVKTSSLGFQAMTKESRILEELFGSKVLIEPVTIDEVMYYIKHQKRGG
ncbi:ABC transporter ATP-binding protein [Corticicoccus populi]|uniref:ABC transporter ATP-binding protein n=1 Tax=Corticicoccus populi TaxID=1812821 RepID=A0ABW5WWY5_9STAP